MNASPRFGTFLLHGQKISYRVQLALATTHFVANLIEILFQLKSSFRVGFLSQLAEIETVTTAMLAQAILTNAANHS